MTKVEAVKEFKKQVEYANKSKTDQRLLWNEFTQHLYDSGMITEKQLYTWDQPKEVK